MQLESGNTIPSGIEPVDELLGGLDRGQLYLVHGEASGKSLFGIKFLIEGLKHGENGALVIRYSPEDAVRRFARLGYDCLEDVYSGRLVILEYSDDIIQKIGKLRELTPVLRELEWLLGETRPERLIFDPVASVLAGAEGNVETHTREFAEWARSFGATVVLIANDSNHEIIKSFEPLVAESFRFYVREVGERAGRFIAFEKSSAIPDQAIEVDPSRGVFLLGRLYETEGAGRHQAAPRPPSVAELESIREELRSVRDRTREAESEPIDEIDLMDDASIRIDHTQLTPDTADQEPLDTLQTGKLTPVEEKEFQAPRARVIPQTPDSTTSDDLHPAFGELSISAIPTGPLFEGQLDELSDLLDDLTGSASPLDLDLDELESLSDNAATATLDRPDSAAGDREQVAVGSHEAQPSVAHAFGETAADSQGADQPEPRQRRERASDLRIDSAIAARAVELLLHSPEAVSDADFSSRENYDSRQHEVRKVQQVEPPGDREVRAKDCNVLIVEDDPEIRDLVTQTLGDYTLEVVHDGMSGLAKLISFKPDLVVLDFDLPVIDGFKVLTLIRSSLNVPIIIVSGSRMRAIDRVMASELGADYYLTKPFSAKELKYKARQLIARYRGLNSWITNPSSPSSAAPFAHDAEPAAPLIASEPDLFMPYTEFASEVEKRVKAAMENGTPFSIVGCRLMQMTAEGGQLALRLFEIVRGLARDADLTSTNPRNDLVILLADAGAAGARAFAGRLRARVMDELNQDPTLWMRSFPDLEESTEAAALVGTPAHTDAFNRRAGDQANAVQGHPKPFYSRADEIRAQKGDPRNSYIDFLDHL